MQELTLWVFFLYLKIRIASLTLTAIRQIRRFLFVDDFVVAVDVDFA